MVAFEPDDGNTETQLDDKTIREVDIRGVSVVWNVETDDVPAVAYHGCASPFEAIGLLIVGALTMAHEYAFPVDDSDLEDDDEPGEDA